MLPFLAGVGVNLYNYHSFYRNLAISAYSQQYHYRPGSSQREDWTGDMMPSLWSLSSSDSTKFLGMVLVFTEIHCGPEGNIQFSFDCPQLTGENLCMLGEYLVNPAPTTPSRLTSKLFIQSLPIRSVYHLNGQHFLFLFLTKGCEQDLSTTWMDSFLDLVITRVLMHSPV